MRVEIVPRGIDGLGRPVEVINEVTGAELVEDALVVSTEELAYDGETYEAYDIVVPLKSVNRVTVIGGDYVGKEGRWVN